MNASRSIQHALFAGIAVATLAACGSSTTGPISTQQALVPEGKPPSGTGEFLGCPYPSGDVWQQNIANAQIDPNSAANIQATIDGGGGGGFSANAPTTDELINMANMRTPIVKVLGKVKWHTPYSPWPWASNFYIEPLSDGHAMVLQTQGCLYYEGYNVSYGNGALSMYNGGMWNLNSAFVRPAAGGISDASGIPLGLLAVRPEELSAGYIGHAVGWDGVANSWSQTACASPAGKTTCTDDIVYKGPSGDTPMPYGAHIRLKATFDDSGFPKEAKAVAEALKAFGAYAYDTGCCNTFFFTNDSNGAPVWTSQDSSALRSITISNFDRVVAP
ncbi:MAG TPA: hypothetical protein VHS56_08470 [Candidatus Cybelea sp.]|nr:hypothetical protein [Candidatus Cybelea sp.]